MAELVKLEELYFNPNKPSSFTSPNKLKWAAEKEGLKRTLRDIMKWLEEKEVYTLHRKFIRKFQRNRVIVGGIDYQWDVDVMNLSRFGEENDGYIYVLVMIDIFSRYLWTRPLKSKKPSDIIQSLQSAWKEGRKPHHIRTDKGG